MNDRNSYKSPETASAAAETSSSKRRRPWLAGKRWYIRNRIQPNDVVAFRSEGPNSPLYFRRVAGLPGDEIEIKNERVFINGSEWDDPHAVFNAPLPPFSEMVNYGPVKIPLDRCFLLGDNRRMSKDS